MTTIRRRTAVALLIGVAIAAIACGPGTAPSPGPSAQSEPFVPMPSPPITFPPASGPSRTFTFDAAGTERQRLADPGWWWGASEATRQSSLVLYQNGAIVLQFPNGRLNGQYREEDGQLAFLWEFQGRTVDDARRDDATGVLNGNSLTITFKETMLHSTFENAVYGLAH